MTASRRLVRSLFLVFRNGCDLPPQARMALVTIAAHTDDHGRSHQSPEDVRDLSGDPHAHLWIEKLVKHRWLAREDGVFTVKTSGDPWLYS